MPQYQSFDSRKRGKLRLGDCGLMVRSRNRAASGPSPGPAPTHSTSRRSEPARLRPWPGAARHARQHCPRRPWRRGRSRPFAPAHSSTPSRTFGCRSPRSLPVPPSVTSCKIETSAPMTAVSPTTRPVPWSINTPLPIGTAGWISTAKTWDTRLCRKCASSRRPSHHSQWPRRCHCSAWKPL